MEITVIHYTKNPDFKLCKIEIKNEFMWCKPNGGIWTSPIESKYGWDKWCSDEGFCDTNTLTKVEMILDVTDMKNLIIIDREEDLDKLIWTHDRLFDKLLSDIPEVLSKLTEDISKTKKRFIPSFGKEYIDFEAMVQKGIDAIYLTEKGQWKTRLIYPRNLYGWDCETVLILNERCIKLWRVKQNL